MNGPKQVYENLYTVQKLQSGAAHLPLELSDHTSLKKVATQCP
jgi:hypothetical protein